LLVLGLEPERADKDVVVFREREVGVAKREVSIDGSSELSSEPFVFARAITASHCWILLMMSFAASRLNVQRLCR